MSDDIQARIKRVIDNLQTAGDLDGHEKAVQDAIYLLSSLGDLFELGLAPVPEKVDCDHLTTSIALPAGDYPKCEGCGATLDSAEYAVLMARRGGGLMTPREVEKNIENIVGPTKPGLGFKDALVDGKALIRYDLIPRKPLEDLAKLFGFGANKYAPRNWEQGFLWSTPYNAMIRHATEFNDGHDYDDGPGGSGLPHPIAIAWNALILAQFMITHPELDDRRNGPAAPPLSPPQ
jgi:hypothetical protein